MITGVVIINASTTQTDEVVVFRASGYSGSVTYRHDEMEIELDFDKLVCTVRPEGSTELYSWEAADPDLAYHEADFGVYLCGGGGEDEHGLN